MTRIPLRLLVYLITILSALGSVATAEAPLPMPAPEAPDYRVKLDNQDLQLITLEVLKGHPSLSASAGIKFVDGYGGYSSEGDEIGPLIEVNANVIFYPHTESGGIKQAFEAHCRRNVSNKDWTCFAVEIRRYVRLETQDFEVRVKGDLNLAGINAVIEATRQPAAAAALEFSEVADTANMIFACGDKYIVSWGSKDGMGRIGLEAQLRAGGNPAEPADWQVRKEPAL